MKKLLLLLLFGSQSWAQLQTPIAIQNLPPSPGIVGTDFTIDDQTPPNCPIGKAHCTNKATFAQVLAYIQANSGGSHVSFASLTGGTNLTAAMLVGSGSTLSFSGLGTISATTAAALAAAPNQCPGGQFAVGISTSGNANCAVPAGGGNVNATGSPVSGNLTQFSGTTTITNADLSGDCTTSGTLTLTCLRTNGNLFGTFAIANAATPPSIGNVTPGAGSFSPLKATGVTGLTQCLHADSTGLISGTGIDCSSSFSTVFTNLTAGTNTSAAMVVGTGASLAPSGLGTITGTDMVNTLHVYPSGDGSGATDCVNIQAALTTMGGASPTSSLNHSLELRGNYTINCKLIMTMPATNAVPFWITGSALITQVTANTGIMEFQIAGVAGYAVGPRIDGISFTWSSSQPATSTAAVALGFRCTNPTSCVGGEIFNVAIRNSRFSNGYSFVANTQVAGQFGLWNLTIEKDEINVYSGPAIFIVSPTAVGQPNISIKQITTAQPTADNVSPIIQVTACDNLLIENMEFLQHINNHPTILLSSVGAFTLLSNKCEACTYSAVAAGPLWNKVIMTQNSYGFVGPFSLNNVTINGGFSHQPIFLSVENGAANQAVTMAAPFIGIGAGTGTLTLFSSGPMTVNVLGSPSVGYLGSGPGVLRLVDSGATSSASNLEFTSPPGGVMPTTMQGDASYVLGTTATPLTMTSVNIWNTPLTANRTINLSSGNGSTNADNLWDGTEFIAKRTTNATGNFTLTIINTGAIPASVVVPIGGTVHMKYGYGLGWVQLDSGGSFDVIGGGTNISSAMLVGTGASLGPTGSGVVNANQINGTTIPASAPCLASNGSNQLIACTTSSILSGTTGTISGSVANGACDTGTVTLTGVTTSMVLAASPNSAASPGIGWSVAAYVSAANTATVQVCNGTGSTGSPTSTAYNVRAIP